MIIKLCSTNYNQNFILYFFYILNCIAWNKIGDNGAKAFAVALSSNQTLTEFYIRKLF